ncbi:MAG: hypothetical protein COV08_02970 [Candidatus Vogelbacteria bacterium CG10_big_fil_rev_8_21_14_0_10_49_38]|uniref:Uncharacterized protein n=1 Tax=Candidatus Vogelbacteria bacterium CG10_big_fil_rev_8_21_14_0_10_49_38 TaxID=1975043 RepID=A0A2H0RH60_9BACT|nr:MAG: hypothetical protein BK006_02980 [bacterium CG10_49_38]PIR45833.1 MAG: hypothetical protein COV08_02970 [Candidatus Vogelbacteria bacterium CG10_big_fil_rev_8_21_14_0_10_49_38]
MSKINRQSGLVKLIILIVVAVLILSYLGVNIQKIAESETGQANFAYLWQIMQKIGDWFVNLYQKHLAGYLEGPWVNIKETFTK